MTAEIEPVHCIQCGRFVTTEIQESDDVILPFCEECRKQFNTNFREVLSDLTDEELLRVWRWRAQ